MRTIKIGKIDEQIKSLYDFFKLKEGSEHISCLGALQGLNKILQDLKPKNILEFGGGIGALSYFCMNNTNANLTIYEDNSFCLNQLEKNLSAFKERYSIISDYNNFKPLPYKNYELILADGGPYNLISEIVKNIRGIRIIFFEGRRIPMQVLFRKALKKKYIFKTIKYEYENNNKNTKCAYVIYCQPCKNVFLRKINYYYQEIISLIDFIRIRGFMNYIKYDFLSKIL